MTEPLVHRNSVYVWTGASRLRVWWLVWTAEGWEWRDPTRGRAHG